MTEDDGELIATRSHGFYTIRGISLGNYAIDKSRVADK